MGVRPYDSLTPSTSDGTDSDMRTATPDPFNRDPQFKPAPLIGSGPSGRWMLNKAPQSFGKVDGLTPSVQLLGRHVKRGDFEPEDFDFAVSVWNGGRLKEAPATPFASLTDAIAAARKLSQGTDRGAIGIAFDRVGGDPKYGYTLIDLMQVGHESVRPLHIENGSVWGERWGAPIVDARFSNEGMSPSLKAVVDGAMLIQFDWKLPRSG